MRNVTNFNFEELNKFDKIYVLVSGGIDSTLLFEYCLQYCDNNKVYAVNCFNPFESSSTLNEIAKYERFIQIKPTEPLDYASLLNKSFMKIEEAKRMRKEGKYSKSVFPCCKYIKHNSFKNHPLFKEPNTVVISGIKPRDGMQRRLWLQYLRTGKRTTLYAQEIQAPTFYYRHKEGQLYCYPFRDYDMHGSIEKVKGTDYPKEVMDELYAKYPNLEHSGCYLCPVLVTFSDKMLKSKKTSERDRIRIEKSIRYYEELKKKPKVD